MIIKINVIEKIIPFWSIDFRTNNRSEVSQLIRDAWTQRQTEIMKGTWSNTSLWIGKSGKTKKYSDIQTYKYLDQITSTNILKMRIAKIDIGIEYGNAWATFEC